MRKIFLTSVMAFACVCAFAAEDAGKITKYAGKVSIYDGVSPRGTAVEKNDTPFALKNRIATNRASSALLELKAGDKVALSENSVVSFASDSRMNPEKGKVVFSITKRGQASGVTVGLTTAVIGVKGTQFLVDMTAEGKCKVYLKEGSIEVTSTAGEFAKHKAYEIDEYEAYIRQITGEYDKYLSDLQKEYTEYVKSFDMQAGQAISISGSDVNDVEFDRSALQAFDLLY